MLKLSKNVHFNFVSISILLVLNSLSGYELNMSSLVLSSTSDATCSINMYHE